MEILASARPATAVARYVCIQHGRIESPVTATRADVFQLSRLHQRAHGIHGEPEATGGRTE
jgi:hypothetical protein